MNKGIDNNEYEYVDLGLPSGTLWARQNIGASKPSEIGLYFQWGDTIGYTKDQVGIDKQFNYEDYKFSISGSGKYFSKYTAQDVSLKLEDDAAHVNMGGDWHMPTYEQVKELIDNTTSEWAALDDINGKLFTSKKDTSRSLFFPVNGYAWDGLHYGNVNNCIIWLSTKNSNYAYYGQNACFSSGGTYFYGSGRGYGFPIRGVIG